MISARKLLSQLESALPRVRELKRKIDVFQVFPDSVARLIVLVAALTLGVLIALWSLPPRVTNHKLQVATAIAQESGREPKYAGATACASCHEAQRDFIAGGYHRNVACETCHGPAKQHAAADNPMSFKPVVPTGRRFCPTCHEYSAARPRGFPQINPIVHNPMKACVECHDPHDPKPQHIPEECSACHAKTDRMKAVSSHALLKCTVCHEAPEQHRVSPTSVRPSKPMAREFCGKCHSKTAAEKDAPKDAPKVDLASHGQKYLCWECHYPHMPEVPHDNE